MTCKLLVLLTIVSCAFSCERFTFEEGFDELFSTDFGLCPSMPGTWAIGTFESLNMKGFHERSTQFIYPDHLISCVSSPLFDMVPGGIIEVNTFTATSGIGNIIQVMVLDEFDADAGMGIKFGFGFPGAWSTMRITIIGSSPFRGRISIIGIALEHSIVLVDSFRYLPPGISEIDCLLYEPCATDSTNVIPTEPTIEDKSGEDISTSPRPSCDDRKDSLIVRLKMMISVAVNVSVVAPLAQIIN